MSNEIYEPSEKAAKTLLSIICIGALCTLVLYATPNFDIALLVMIPLILCGSFYMVSTIMQDDE